MPERKKPDESQRVARLLLKAIESLPAREKNKVLEYLVTHGLLQERGIEPPPGLYPMSYTSSLPPSRGRTDIPKEELAKLVSRGRKMSPEVKMSPEQQMVPVRFSQDQYEIFKAWCEENGFSMAVVVRGLVERFLEEQGRRAS